MYLLAPFIVQNQNKTTKKKNLEWTRVMTTHWAQNDPIALHKIFSRKTINIISINFLASFTVQNSKTKFRGDPDLCQLRHF